MKRNRLIWSGCVFFICLSIVISCSKNDEFDNLTVEDEFLFYFNTFTEEGAKRNIIIDFDQYPVTGEIGTIDIKDVVGQCFHMDDQPNHIRIDRQAWQTSTKIMKEYIIFHELGHCYLSREHLDEKLSSGLCKSIMASGTGSCMFNYNWSTRDYYLDELFEIQ